MTKSQHLTNKCVSQAWQTNAEKLWNTVKMKRFKKSMQMRSLSNGIQDSLWIPDSFSVNFWLQIPTVSGVPDSLSCIPHLKTEIPKFPGFRIPQANIFSDISGIRILLDGLFGSCPSLSSFIFAVIFKPSFNAWSGYSPRSVRGAV